MSAAIDGSSGEAGAVVPVQSIAEGWIPVGGGFTASCNEITISATPLEENGLVSTTFYCSVRLTLEVWLDPGIQLIAKVHQAASGDRASNSYHLVIVAGQCYIARHNVVFATAAVPGEGWQTAEIAWVNGRLTSSLNGIEVCRCFDDALALGFCAIGVTGGTARVRSLRVSPADEAGAKPVRLPDGWVAFGSGTAIDLADTVRLTAPAGSVRETGLISERDYNDVELAFRVRLSADAVFVAKLHQQNAANPDANSYHLVSTSSRCYVARHGMLFKEIPLVRGRWQQVVLRWLDQRLEVLVEGVLRLAIIDQLLQSGYCVLAVSAGQVELCEVRLQDLCRRAGLPPRLHVHHGREGANVPFTSTPRRNLMYHVWPVRGSMWRWNLDQLKARIDLFNGRRLIGIVHDSRSEDPDTVKSCLAGLGCEFLVAPNDASGEVVTFPKMLESLKSGDWNEVTFYGHAKGVRHEPSVPATVRRWAEVYYRTALDDWLAVRAQLERFALTGAFRMVGRFKAHQYLGDWHYSGTYFWLRHGPVFGRDCLAVPAFYGGVEAWPGMHFSREETGCLLFDNLRMLAYHEQFWASLAPEIERWESRLAHVPTPADLLNPPAFEGHEWPRLEQRPEEFEWFLQQLIEARPVSLLTIGAMHGGVEWHVARHFRSAGREIRITVVELSARRELLAVLQDARARFGQQIELVTGDSTAAATRARLASQYDAVFIDGDHSYRGSRMDLDLALSLNPRLIGLHDVVDSDWHAQAGCCVSRLWAEVRQGYRTAERSGGVWGGIGLIYPDSPGGVM